MSTNLLNTNLRCDLTRLERTNMVTKLEDRIKIEQRHLKRKWKGHIQFENYKSQERVAIDVPRRQPVSLD